MGADQLVRLLPAYKGEDNSTVWKAVDAVLLGLDKVCTDEATRLRLHPTTVHTSHHPMCVYIYIYIYTQVGCLFLSRCRKVREGRQI